MQRTRARAARAGLGLAIGLIALSGPASALPTRAVDDRALALDPYGPNLERRAAQWGEDLGIQVRIVTLRAGRHDLAQLSRRDFEGGRLGAASTNGAVLMLVDVEGGRARIEVSHQLAAVFPDALLHDLARYQLAPYASYAALGMAVSDVLYWMKQRAFEFLASGSLASPAELHQRPEFQEWLATRSGRSAAEVELPDLPDDLDLKAPVRPERSARYAPSPLVSESVDAWSRALADLVGWPELELVTPASRVMRARHPVAPFQARRNHEALEASRPLVVRVDGDRAVVDSPTPARGFAPWLLQRVDGLWRIDEAERCKNLFYTTDGGVIVNPRNPYQFGLQHLPRILFVQDLSPVDLAGASLPARLGEVRVRLAAGPTAEAHLALAELLFRNAFSALDGLVHYREAARLAPDDPRILRIAADRAAYLGFWHVAIPLLERIGPEGWPALARVYAADEQWAEAERVYRLALERDPASAEARAGLRATRRRHVH